MIVVSTSPIAAPKISPVLNSLESKTCCSLRFILLGFGGGGGNGIITQDCLFLRFLITAKGKKQ